MPERSCNFIPSDKVLQLLGLTTIEEMVKAVVNKAYDQNMNLRKSIFADRFILFTVDGKVADGGKLLEALKDRPDAVERILPVVCLTEENGEDVAHIMFQPEIKKSYPKLYEGMKEFLSQPPNVSVEQLIKEVNDRV